KDVSLKARCSLREKLLFAFSAFSFVFFFSGIALAVKKPCLGNQRKSFSKAAKVLISELPKPIPEGITPKIIALAIETVDENLFEVLRDQSVPLKGTL